MSGTSYEALRQHGGYVMQERGQVEIKVSHVQYDRNGVFVFEEGKFPFAKTKTKTKK